MIVVFWCREGGNGNNFKIMFFNHLKTRLTFVWEKFRVVYMQKEVLVQINDGFHEKRGKTSLPL